VGEAATTAEALRRIPATSPDVAILDARLPDGSGIDVCREVRSSMPAVRCQIGDRLFLAEETVKNYVSWLLAKLGMQRRTHAAVYGATIRDK
jgi:DNA-binding NarL/FixJ family response regulator